MTKQEFYQVRKFLHQRRESLADAAEGVKRETWEDEEARKIFLERLEGWRREAELDEQRLVHCSLPTTVIEKALFR